MGLSVLCPKDQQTTHMKAVYINQVTLCFGLHTCHMDWMKCMILACLQHAAIIFLFLLSRGLFLAKVDCFYSHSVNALSLPPPEHALKALITLPLCQS